MKVDILDHLYRLVTSRLGVITFQFAAVLRIW